MDLGKSWTRRIKWFHPVSLQLCKEFAKVDGNYRGFNPLTITEASISFLLRKSSLNKGISNKEAAVKPKFAIHDVKNEVSFLSARTSPDKKMSTIAWNSNLRALWWFVILLLGTFSGFFFPFFPWVFPLPLATLLTIAWSSSTLHRTIEIKKKQKQTKKNKNVSAMGHFSREILIPRHWRQEVSLSYWFAVSWGEIIEWFSKRTGTSLQNGKALG